MTSDTVLPELMVQLFGRITSEMSEETLGDLRMSHVRVLSGIPPDGVSVTALAREIGMTKQGCGQFVTTLTRSGHVRTSPDAADRRVRLVHRTAKGEAFMAAVYGSMAQIESGFAAEVGERRFGTFKRVLAELAGSGSAPGRPPART